MGIQGPTCCSHGEVDNQKLLIWIVLIFINFVNYSKGYFPPIPIDFCWHLFFVNAILMRWNLRAFYTWISMLNKYPEYFPFYFNFSKLLYLSGYFINFHFPLDDKSVCVSLSDSLFFSVSISLFYIYFYYSFSIFKCLESISHSSLSLRWNTTVFFFRKEQDLKRHQWSMRKQDEITQRNKNPLLSRMDKAN